ncbi:transposase [Xenococcus sp. PCC 7305]|uniref:transposase n=1 Tax=Xenococcus sp. PCC 7305 TaxID=102125 RepID=UPI0002ACD984|nr:transposase [Xenococcus sp. PCC 7305]
MKYNPQHHHRRSIRLPKYDYSRSGLYFVTICTYQKLNWFGEVCDDKICLNQIGKIVAREWLRSSEIRQEIELDEWVVMPNHFHGIVVINQNHDDGNIRKLTDPKTNNSGAHSGAHSGTYLDTHLGASLAPLRMRKPRSLSSFVAGFKSAVTKQVRQICQEPNLRLWQRNYYESVIRDRQQLDNVRRYIINNPLCWHEDPENQNHQSIDFPF